MQGGGEAEPSEDPRREALLRAAHDFLSSLEGGSRKALLLQARTLLDAFSAQPA